MDLSSIAERAVHEFGARQDPKELAEFLKWLSELVPQPKFVIEIGVFRGGNMWAMQQVAKEALYIGIDTTFARLKPCQFKSGTMFVCGKSFNLVSQVRPMYDPAESLVYVDADHSYKAVSSDASKYPAKYQVFHDVKDDRRADVKRLVCHFYREHIREFDRVFSHNANFAGIGVRHLPEFR